MISLLNRHSKRTNKSTEAAKSDWQSAKAAAKRKFTEGTPAFYGFAFEFMRQVPAEPKAERVRMRPPIAAIESPKVEEEPTVTPPSTSGKKKHS